ncbi:unnamed protein product [Orchesella dallaii]|uniref:Uncharacterized protein n=1 Tax=Orchesella dallaii TaxID=48710 RepID=A0ABP1RMX8_9HEXA
MGWVLSKFLKFEEETETHVPIHPPVQNIGDSENESQMRMRGWGYVGQEGDYGGANSPTISQAGERHFPPAFNVIGHNEVEGFYRIREVVTQQGSSQVQQLIAQRIHVGVGSSITHPVRLRYLGRPVPVNASIRRIMYVAPTQIQQQIEPIPIPSGEVVRLQFENDDEMREIDPVPEAAYLFFIRIVKFFI